MVKVIVKNGQSYGLPFFFKRSGLVVFWVLLIADISFADPESRIVTVGVYENAPKVFFNEAGRPAGIFIDIIEYIAKEEGWRLHYVSGTWGEGLDRLGIGEIDLMPDVAYTTDRGRLFAFHQSPVMSDWFQVYAGKGSGIQSILDLEGKRIAVLERSVQQETFTRLLDGFGVNARLIALPDYQAIFKRVAEGEADAAVTNRFYGLIHANIYGLENTAVVFNPTHLFFAASKGNHEELLSKIDAHLSSLKNNPQSIYYTSLKRWASEDVRFRLPAWVGIVGIAAGAILLMSMIGSILLKRQVNARTRELWEANREMEVRIKDRTSKLAEAMKKAQEADFMKSAFLATMSHELRTPLNSIIGFTGILLQELAGPLNEEQHKQMGMVQSSARHLLALINDVLDISKIEAGQLALSVSAFDLRLSIEKVVSLISPLAEKKGIDLKIDIGDDVAAVTTDQRRLEQIVLNLLNNAVKFTPKGHVHVSCRRKRDDYLVSVSDSGIGIHPEAIPRLFQPFHQVDIGLARKYEGTGLGLFICRKLTDLMGGSISVESRPGKGSTFAVRFPIHPED